MKLHFLGFLIGSSALAAAVSFAQPIAEDISVIGGSFSLHDSIGRISTLAIPNFKIDARTAATLIARPIDVIDLIVAQANPTFVSKGKIFIKTLTMKFDLDFEFRRGKHEHSCRC